ncbi:hypothetical protein [Ornithinibacillus californiensis]|uniref:hypothetical protein n=1 Tax=Ornithinibacillus californiensis TaxID=161536 RepID=UPI00064DAC38|nr:hypothetical protein [Ornithinibacillus californiensis]
MKNLEQMDMINARRDDAIVEHFVRNKGRKVFILTESFPFMFIGNIKDVIEDMIALDVLTTNVAALEGREWYIHIHSINVFYIETGIGEKIPDLKD